MAHVWVLGTSATAVFVTVLSCLSPAASQQIYRPINPKAVTRNELYGFLHPTTREWKEGLVSVTFRDMANNSTNKHQWIVLDGDIDAGRVLHLTSAVQSLCVVQHMVSRTLTTSTFSQQSARLLGPI